MSAGKRWLVERTRDVFEDVGAEDMRVLDCGALQFMNGTIFDPKIVLIYAPGQWITVLPEDDGEES